MNTKRQGFLQALGVAAYCTLIGVFIMSGNSIVGKIDNTVGPILFLLLFSTSVLICAVLVFYKPYKLFVDGKKKEALEVVLATAASLFVFLVLFLIGLTVFK